MGAAFMVLACGSHSMGTQKRCHKEDKRKEVNNKMSETKSEIKIKQAYKKIRAFKNKSGLLDDKITCDELILDPTK